MTMDSELVRRAAETTDRMLSLLTEEHLRREIDGRIDSITATFNVQPPPVVSTEHFHQALAELVRQIYGRGLRFPLELSPPQALAEALLILEQGYQGTQQRGYDAALADATAPGGNGLAGVLRLVAELIKARERRTHVQWVYITGLEALDWQTRCRVAEILRHRALSFLPPQVRGWTSARLVNAIPQLVAFELSCHTLTQYAAGPVSTPRPS